MDTAATLLTVLLLFWLLLQHWVPLGSADSPPDLTIRRNHRSGRSVNTSSVVLAADRSSDEDDHRNFVYKVVRLSSGAGSADRRTPGSKPPASASVVFVTAPPDVRHHRRYDSDEFDGRLLLPSALIVGLRVEDVAGKGVSYDADGTPNIQAGKPLTVRLFGDAMSDASQFRFVSVARQRGDDCDDLPFTANVNVTRNSLTNFSALVHLRLPSLAAQQMTDDDETEELPPAFYVCSMAMSADGRVRWIHQGKEPGVKLRTYEKTLPLWFQLAIIVLLLSLSGLFSGLNLGLMALDRTDLKIYENTGSEKEKGFARAISPVRDHGNYLLCTLLLGNVLVNSSLTILLDDLTSGIIAVVGSTMGIVIFGEIVPQAICSRHGLAIGAHTVWITKFFMLLTFPLSYPISLILNWILGEEIGAYYNRERLKELIKVTNEYHDLEKEEINIISGALEMRRKTVGNIMTRLEDIFMLGYDSVLDFETVSQVLKQGFSRVPIYERARNNIVGLLFIKELALVDPEDAVPLKTLCKFYQRQCNFVFEDTTLDVVFKDFKEGHKGHMAFVQRVNSSGDGDPFYETVGLVTLEDVIEELIQAEIVDETDVWIDNRSKRRREKSRLLQDFSSFAVQYRVPATHKISAQLALSAFQFLSSSVDPFHADWISENVLRRLVQQGPVVQFIRGVDMGKKFPGADAPPAADATLIYQQGKAADYFVLILEGRVEVTVGKESLVFESGPFSHFGSYALTAGLGVFALGDELGESTKGSVKCWQSSNGTLFHSGRAFPISEPGISGGVTGAGAGQQQQQQQQQSSPPSGAATHHQMFVSDYTVRALTDVTYLRVSRFLYQAARSATLLERAQITSDRLSNRADSNGRLSVDSSQLTLTVSSSYRCSSSDSIVDANCADGHLSDRNQETISSTADNAHPSSYY